VGEASAAYYSQLVHNIKRVPDEEVSNLQQWRSSPGPRPFFGADATRGFEWPSIICLPSVDLGCDVSEIKMGRIWARPHSAKICAARDRALALKTGNGLPNRAIAPENEFRISAIIEAAAAIQ
jgi:hypothetical protein